MPHKVDVDFVRLDVVGMGEIADCMYMQMHEPCAFITHISLFSRILKANKMQGH